VLIGTILIEKNVNGRVDGVESLEQTAAVKPDLIIMDIRMP